MKLKKVADAVLGNPSEFSMQARLFNAACLVEGVWFLYFSITAPTVVSRHAVLIIVLYLASGLFAGVAFYHSRVRRSYKAFIFPIWITCLFGATVTWFVQGGSQGTAGYVLAPGLTGFLILAPRKRTKWIMLAVTVLQVAGLVTIDFMFPQLIVPYPSREARFMDFLGTMVPVLLVSGFIAMYFVGNYQVLSADLQEKKQKIETLTSSLRRYLPQQLVQSLEDERSDRVSVPVRRRITVFFSDIKDFTLTTDSMEPEDLTSLLNEYLTEMTAIALKWGGTIDKFIGDAMMVFFGAPSETDPKSGAVRCVRMAIEMQRRMRDLGEKWYETGIERPLQMRVGVNTGIAAVGDFGTAERLSYTAIGGEVNLASRLQGICMPGGIILSHSTWALVKEDIRCRRRPEVATVKGIARGITVYDVVDPSLENGEASDEARAGRGAAVVRP